MIVTYLGNVSDFSALDVHDREQKINQIFSSLYAENEIVQEVIIDGNSYRDHYETVLKQNLAEIREVRIETINGDVFVKDMIQELYKYLPRVNRAIESISDLFYGDMEKQDWNLFSQLLEGIGWVNQAANIILLQLRRAQEINPLFHDISLFVEHLPNLLSELEQVLAEEEHVAAGDLIKYEIGELFQQFERSIQSKVNI
ncbi:hypothetical protein [Cohnella laeviribosi]|jgi:hypothetical protein|uniref:hypothetical protein n=1 Tax=Cohnella laeviribosi TaxID=380174 RepID=UPI00036A1667|nr:hypothetical protein [Cohnella laeviribosi]